MSLFESVDYFICQVKILATDVDFDGAINELECRDAREDNSQMQVAMSKQSDYHLNENAG